VPHVVQLVVEPGVFDVRVPIPIQNQVQSINNDTILDHCVPNLHNEIVTLARAGKFRVQRQITGREVVAILRSKDLVPFVDDHCFLHPEVIITHGHRWLANSKLFSPLAYRLHLTAKCNVAALSSIVVLLNDSSPTKVSLSVIERLRRFYASSQPAYAATEACPCRHSCDQRAV
jgi:hypothetical protein